MKSEVRFLLFLFLISFIFFSCTIKNEKQDVTEVSTTETILEENEVAEDIIQEKTTVEKIEEKFPLTSENLTITYENLSIHIQDNTYTQEIELSIIAQPNVPINNTNIEPISPLFKIHNDNVFAKKPVILEYPLNLKENQFALPFYYDETKNTIEGIPILYENSEKIVFTLNHFSNIFIGQMNEEQLQTYKTGRSIITNFKPGIDDFKFINYGSTIAPRGHCSGQCLGALWYFNNIRRFDLESNENHLHGLLDNNTDEDTPNIWQDDTLLYRFASSIHKDATDQNNKMSFIRNYINLIDDSDNLLDNFSFFYNPKLQWQGISASLIATERPQLIIIEGDKTAHAIIAYQIIGNKLYVADPNYPGQLRYITYNGETFEPYASGSNFRSITTDGRELYKKIYYAGEFALVDTWKIETRWQEVENKLMANEYFPDPMMIMNKDKTGYKDYYFSIDVLDPDYMSKLKFRVVDKNGNPLSVFNDISINALQQPVPLLSPDEGYYYVIELPEDGKNRIGFYYGIETLIDGRKDFVWHDFEWVDIFANTNLVIEPQPSTVSLGETITFEAFFEEPLANVPKFNWLVDMADSFVSQRTLTYTFDTLGNYLIEVMLPSGLKITEFNVLVVDEPVSEDPSPENIETTDQTSISGNYSCIFEKTAVETIVFGEFKDTLWGNAEYHKIEAQKYADYYLESAIKTIGVKTEDRNNFKLTINSDDTCTISFSDFLGFELAYYAIENIPFNNGNISFLETYSGRDYTGTIQFNLGETATMKGEIKCESLLNEHVKEMKIISFEGTKVN